MKKLAYILVASALLFSCEKEEEHNHDEHEHGESEHHIDNEVAISHEQFENLGIKLGSFSKIKTSEVIEANGELSLSPQNIADVHVLIGGVITRINVVEGNKVRKGQTLATLQHPDIIQLQEDLISKNSELSFLESEYKRQEKLYEEKVSSGKEYQKVKAEYNGAKSLVDALKTKVRLIGLNPENIITGNISQSINITSPISGKVSLVETNMGEYVSTDKRLFQVVDNQQLHCAFRIYENDILKVQEGQEIEVTSPSFLNQSFIATIYAVNPAFEENPKSLHVQASFEKVDSRFISGMYITGKIQTDSLSKIMVPRSAVVIEEDKKFVFILEKEDEESDEGHEGHDHGEHEGHDHGEHKEEQIHFIKVEVNTGIEEGEWIEVINSSDFPVDAEIALSSAYYLQAEIGKEETEHEH